MNERDSSCYQSQNYKIWKQFTTHYQNIDFAPTLLSIAKLQNLKAIHNYPQRWGTARFVVINRKTTKFESNSQHHYIVQNNCPGCYQSQNYKIWKQFTTQVAYLAVVCQVVINRKTTKFESNSQLSDSSNCWMMCCYQSQNYKIWKQFTTALVSANE